MDTSVPARVKLRPVEISKGDAFGLSALEIKCGNEYLLAHPDASVSDITPSDANRMVQLISLGSTLTELGLSFPKYELGLIVVVAARSGWIRLKDKNRGTVQADIQAKILKASLDSMEFLTAMISATSQKYAKEFREYMTDPDNKEFPDLQVANVKDFKDLLETMQKMVVFTVQAGTDEMIRDKTDITSKGMGGKGKDLTPVAKAPVLSISEMLAEQKKSKVVVVPEEPMGRNNLAPMPIEDTVDSTNETGPKIEEWDLVKMPAIDLGDEGNGKES